MLDFSRHCHRHFSEKFLFLHFRITVFFDNALSGKWKIGKCKMQIPIFCSVCKWKRTYQKTTCACSYVFPISAKNNAGFYWNNAEHSDFFWLKTTICINNFLVLWCSAWPLSWSREFSFLVLLTKKVNINYFTFSIFLSAKMEKRQILKFYHPIKVSELKGPIIFLAKISSIWWTFEDFFVPSWSIWNYFVKIKGVRRFCSTAEIPFWITELRCFRLIVGRK